MIIYPADANAVHDEASRILGTDDYACNLRGATGANRWKLPSPTTRTVRRLIERNTECVVSENGESGRKVILSLIYPGQELTLATQRAYERYAHHLLKRFAGTGQQDATVAVGERIALITIPLPSMKEADSLSQMLQMGQLLLGILYAAKRFADEPEWELRCYGEPTKAFKVPGIPAVR